MQTLPEVQAYFQSRRPWMKRMSRAYLTACGDVVTDWEETLQNVITLTWAHVLSMHARGKWNPNRLRTALLFSLDQHRCGRTIFSASTKPRPRLVLDLNIHLFIDETDDVPSIVQTKVDFEDYVSTLSAKWRGFASDLLTGDDNATLAGKWGVTMARVSQVRRAVHDGYLAFLRAHDID